MQNKYSILVNTCDNFEDCWIPFFKLFTIYWPDFEGKIYLNTEYKDFSYPGLDIVCTKVCEVNKVSRTTRATWSQCLNWAMDAIDTEIVLYMQEDYFLKDNVKNDIVEKYVQMMQNNNDIDGIHLTDQAFELDRKSDKFEGLYTAISKQRYLICCQAALWKKSCLTSFIRTYESAWQFEEFGSQRAALLKPNFFGVDKNWIKLNEFEIIPYIFTGIIQGRWFEQVIPLFDKNNIEIDYSLRGFVKNAPKKPLKLKFLYHWKRLPFLFKNFKDLVRLKNKSI
ncbi:MAG: hypothetical protein Q8R22_01920 [Flavobacterium sp.]|uniref:hypothetical protein n=1 Tax=Flavobacterium sp. TaxID=239 RepID=UPI002734C629|nr:hypothetical protein [Flavobacterium sp.]MDP3679574.1 hypothetical protein [Flavobacterium sp.]